MVQTLSRPRVFVLTFWIVSMLLSAIIGGLLLDFDAGTLMIWLFLTLLFPALVWLMLVAQRFKGAPAPSRKRATSPRAAQRRREFAQSRS